MLKLGPVKDTSAAIAKFANVLNGSVGALSQSQFSPELSLSGTLIQKQRGNQIAIRPQNFLQNFSNGFGHKTVHLGFKSMRIVKRVAEGYFQW